MRPVLNQFAVDFHVMHGYGSATSVHSIAQESLIGEEILEILYIGDFDPSGLHLSPTYRACTGRFSAPVVPFAEAAFCVGRRGGKSRVLALIAVYLATFRDYRPHMAPGECATVVVMAANRSQARSIFRFVIGLLKAVPLIQPMIVDDNTEQITLANRVIIEIAKEHA